MAIIKYQLDSGRTPSYITDGGYYGVGNEYIGIGSGGGTELTKSQLLSWVLSAHGSSPFQKQPPAYRSYVTMTDSEVTTMVNDWCTEKGIS
jgi:hypothetical protein